VRVACLFPLLALAAGCSIDVRHVPDRSQLRLQPQEVDVSRWVDGPGGKAPPAEASFAYPAIVAQGPQELKDPRPVLLSSAVKLVTGPDGGVRLLCGDPEDRAKRIELQLELRDGKVVLAFPADAPFVPWVRSDGSVTLVERSRVEYLPKAEDPALQPKAAYVPLSEGLLRIERDGWLRWE
jgi:hypothetical protein